MDEKVLKKEFKKLDTSINKTVILHFGKDFLNNTKNQKYSKNIEEILDSKNEEYVEIERGYFHYGYALAFTTRLSSDKNLLFIVANVLKTSGNIKKEMPTWHPAFVYALSKDKEIYRTIAYTLETDDWGFYNFKTSDIFINAKNISGTSYHELYKRVENNYKDIGYINFSTIFKDFKNNNLIFPENEFSYESFAKNISEFYNGNIKTIAAGRIVDIEKDYESLVSFLNYKEPIRKLSNADNKFLSIELPEINGSYPDLFGYAQKVDNYTVLRILRKDKENNRNEDIVKIFIDKNKTSAFKKANDNSWHSITCKSVMNWDFPIYNIENPELDKTVFRFTEDILKELPQQKYSKILLLTIANPIVEQLFKSPLKPFAIELFEYLGNYYNQSLSLMLNRYFGKINEKQTDLYKKLGLNKYQVEQFVNVINEKYERSDWWYTYSNIIPIIKCIFSDEKISYNCSSKNINKVFADISNIDNETFNLALKVTKELLNGTYLGWVTDVLRNVKLCAKGKTAIKIIECYVTANTCYGSGYARMYLDYLDIYNQLSELEIPEVENVKLYFTGKDLREQIESAHNLLSDCFNTVRHEVEAERFNKQLKKIEKYVFDDNDFVAISPEKPLDLMNEGTSLHHCVGSYVSRVSAGKTNIMFIRQKEDIGKPFYTVEISNTGNIEQIHGFANCCVEKASNLDSFVQKWVKEKKLKLNNINKVR